MMKINDSLKNRMYSKDDIDELRFYQIPKALIENPKYKNVSMAAKLMYAIMRDRQYLSQKNNWADEEGHIFFYFDCRSLAKLCNVSTSTINRYKKELITAQLLIDVRQGQGKPNRMYILRPESIDNTMNSHNDYTRVAESATLDYLKRLTNDTNINDTELNDTEIFKGLKGDTNVSRCDFSFDILDKQIEKVMTSISNNGVISNLTTDDIKEFFRMYYCLGGQIRNVKPIKLTNEQLENIILSIACINEVEYEPTLDDYKFILLDYFKTNFPDCDYSINHFISGDVLLMRYYNLQQLLE